MHLGSWPSASLAVALAAVAVLLLGVHLTLNGGTQWNASDGRRGRGRVEVAVLLAPRMPSSNELDITRSATTAVTTNAGTTPSPTMLSTGGTSTVATLVTITLPPTSLQREGGQAHTTVQYDLTQSDITSAQPLPAQHVNVTTAEANQAEDLVAAWGKRLKQKGNIKALKEESTAANDGLGAEPARSVDETTSVPTSLSSTATPPVRVCAPPDDQPVPCRNLTSDSTNPALVAINVDAAQGLGCQLLFLVRFVLLHQSPCPRDLDHHHYHHHCQHHQHQPPPPTTTNHH
jgi:hypothetical protein